MEGALAQEPEDQGSSAGFVAVCLVAQLEPSVGMRRCPLPVAAPCSQR